MGFWKKVAGITATIVGGFVTPVNPPAGLALAGAGVSYLTSEIAEEIGKKKKLLRTQMERAAAENAARGAKMERAVREAREAAAIAREKTRQAAERAQQAEQNERAAWLKLEEFNKSLKEPEAHYQLIIALNAIGMAAAAADGRVDECEVKDLDEYISGVAASHLPSKIKARITYLHNHPPSFEKAFSEVQKLEKMEATVPWDTFRQLVLDIIESDGKVTKEEKAFLSIWDGKVSARAALPPANAKKALGPANQAMPSSRGNAQRELVRVLNSQLANKAEEKMPSKRKK